MTKLCLVRHGETDWNAQGRIQGRTDIPLNENGRKQAQLCSKYFKDTEWDVIITSPLKRAKETAKIINEQLHVPIIEMEEFLERSFGDAEGKTREEREVQYPDHLYPNQESREELIVRINSGLKHILQKFPSKKVLLVAHGAVIHTLLSFVSDDKISMDNYLMNACISNIHYEEQGWIVKNYNYVDHLL